MAEIIKLPSKMVIDASVALAFLLPDERQIKVDILFKALAEGKAEIYIPKLFYFEVANGLRSAVISKRLSSLLAGKLLGNLVKLRLEEKKTNWPETFQIALTENMSFYDASYLALAKKEKIPLVSLDKLLAKKAVNRC